MRGTVGLEEIYKEYHQQVQFLSIYIREAHPVDGWWMGRRLTRGLMKKYSPKVSMEHYDPQTIEERRAVAGECETALQYGIHTFVDTMDDHVNKTYAAWPTRLYLVGTDGHIVYAGGQGPYDFHPWKLKKAIDNYLGSKL